MRPTLGTQNKVSSIHSIRHATLIENTARNQSQFQRSTSWFRLNFFPRQTMEERKMVFKCWNAFLAIASSPKGRTKCTVNQVSNWIVLAQRFQSMNQTAKVIRFIPHTSSTLVAIKPLVLGVRKRFRYFRSAHQLFYFRASLHSHFFFCHTFWLVQKLFEPNGVWRAREQVPKRMRYHFDS